LHQRATIEETEKNLVRVFDSVEGSDSVLVFDETDGLFARLVGVEKGRHG
jgi:SpoVK/Ycf46/Vps4 family AAA+-type ATPase